MLKWNNLKIIVSFMAEHIYKTKVSMVIINSTGLVFFMYMFTYFYVLFTDFHDLFYDFSKTRGGGYRPPDPPQNGLRPGFF